MSRKSKFQDVREAKDKRMKKIAAGGCVLLVAVLAFEVPHILHRGGASSSPPPATTPATPSTPATATPGTATPTLTPSALPTALPNSDVAPDRSKSQLLSFSHFTGKDPFVQQVQDLTAGLPDSGGGGAAASGSATSSSSGSSSKSSSGGAAIDTTAARTLATTGTAKISVNGRVQTVKVGAKFPSANPLFRLVSISHGIVKIGIAQGSYSSGAHTVALTAGKSLTLVDTADGIRYKLRLVAAS